MSEERFSLKDHLFNRQKVELLAGWMAGARPGFDRQAFVDEVVARFPELELKQRIDWIANCLRQRLPEDFPTVAGILRDALPAPLDPGLSDDDFGDFIIAPLGVIVEQMGLEAHPELSLDLFEELTQRFSMELSVRSFLNRWPDEVLARMAQWVEHPNYHVRRFVSEGTRPKLPWAQAISLEAGRALPFLDRLHADPTRYVTRSVSNHLNDISKLQPDVVMDMLENWQAQQRQNPKELAWMCRHALRTLVKAGNPRALELLGYRRDAPVEMEALELSPKSVRIGEVMDVSLCLRAAEDCPVLVDYRIDFAKAGGKRGEKVFRLKDRGLPKDRPVQLRKKHRFKGDATTFTLHPGRHVLTVQVNGRRLGTAAFELVAGDDPARAG